MVDTTVEALGKVRFSVMAAPSLSVPTRVMVDCGVVSSAAVVTMMCCDLPPFTVGTDLHVDTFTQGKYLSFEFRSDGVNPWTLTGFDVEAELRGYH